MQLSDVSAYGGAIGVFVDVVGHAIEIEVVDAAAQTKRIARLQVLQCISERRPRLGPAAVGRVVFDGDRATGVEYTERGGHRQVARAGEVILCGGAFNTPQLLQLSGVGNAAELEGLGIDPAAGPQLADLVTVQADRVKTLKEMAEQSRVFYEDYGDFDENAAKNPLRPVAEAPLVVTASGGLFGRSYQYLTSYKGLAFYAKSGEQIHLPGTAEVIAASTRSAGTRSSRARISGSAAADELCPERARIAARRSSSPPRSAAAWVRSPAGRALRCPSWSRACIPLWRAPSTACCGQPGTCLPFGPPG